MTQQVSVHKLDDQGREVWSYRGRLLVETENSRVLEAHFDRGPVRVVFLTFEPGDRMIEYFYDDRWYNIFEVYDRDDRLKGWYCNLARPADFSDGAIRQRDLALDVVVNPAGESVTLDESEFEELPLSAADRERALQGLSNLQRQIEERSEPFDKIRA